jgi:hypothetical protein
MNARYARHFTVDEARALLPDLRRRFAAIKETIDLIRIDQKERSEQRLRILRGNGKGPVLEGAGPLVADLQLHIDEIVGSGVLIKNLETGLIDFPHFLRGSTDHEVVLCYEMSEPDISFWHEIDDGYSGRQPL